ncbi:MAG: hypothetical protein DI598_19880, partial [Pseudopedobacter saltans]
MVIPILLLRIVRSKASSILILLLLFNTSWSQNVVIHSQLEGFVTDSSTGLAVSGADILIDGTTNHTITNDKGFFHIKTGQSFPYKITVSYTGYGSKTVNIDSPNIKIQLATSTQDLDQIVVVGYSQTKKNSVTGTIANIKGDALTAIHGAGFNEKLQGLTPGLQISSNSGVEGGSALVRLRGATSINAGNDPLYIVDGIFINTSSLQSIAQGGQVTNPLADLNPNDIENIQVLKDANATAMYGSRS